MPFRTVTRRCFILPLVTVGLLSLAGSSAIVDDDDPGKSIRNIERRLEAIEKQLERLADEIRKLRQELKATRMRDSSAKARTITFRDIDLSGLYESNRLTPKAMERIPAKIQKLSGQRVTIRGFMYPPFQEDGITSFVLGSDLAVVNHGRIAKISDVIEVKLKKGVTTKCWRRQPIWVTGVLKVKPKIESGEVVRVFRLVKAVVSE